MGTCRPTSSTSCSMPSTWMQARRAALLRQLKRDGRTALWLYAPGYIDETPGLDSMAALTGFTFGRGDHAWIQTMHLVNFSHPITAGLPQDLRGRPVPRLGRSSTWRMKGPPSSARTSMPRDVAGRDSASRPFPNGPPSTAPSRTSLLLCCVASRVPQASTSTARRATCSSRHPSFSGRTPSQAARARSVSASRRDRLRPLRAGDDRREYVRDQRDAAAAIDGAVLYGGCRASESRIQRIARMTRRDSHLPGHRSGAVRTRKVRSPSVKSE